MHRPGLALAVAVDCGLWLFGLGARSVGFQKEME